MPRKMTAGLLLCALLTWAGDARATLLTFDINGATDNDAIPAAYGDHVSTLSAGNFSYGLGNGLTPNIGITYQSVDSGGNTVANNFSFWGTGYADLTNVASAALPLSGGQITLTPDAGWGVRLNSFDLAGYGHSDFTQPVRILDGSGHVLKDYSLVLMPGSTHITLSAGITSSSPIVLQFGTTWDPGIDNVNFDQVKGSVGDPGPIHNTPEPGTLGLMGLGFIGLALGYRRQRNESPG
jgi:hypothetical protein